MGFTMWCLMSVLYAQVGHMVAIEDEVEGLRDEVADLKGEPRPPRVGATRKAAGAVSSAVKDGLSTCATTVTPGGGVDTPGAATPESMGASTLTRRRV
ncbi:hypothetical protein MNEG_0217 [Monoraphidium neglectum]|uniref:Uncharacterized protein n=1 Tax=Monoraphidium neglectum TaxID=145388 RepID=A0A0D2KCD5_9CHLO|nr:hypothetical protein MNEG_0217 [Monoraphidium neglectum]KIZ07718.1 hypothetical protein MNEG_0217 [Monoraphidium neglectum]|eukprot:XP_013906737.1 hypothetical protein MNEG_0217 [Monoraphidium neglectum]